MEGALFRIATSSAVHSCPAPSAVSASGAFLQVRVRPTRRHPKIGYILATVRAKLGLTISHKSAKEKPRNSRRGYALCESGGHGIRTHNPLRGT